MLNRTTVLIAILTGLVVFLLTKSCQKPIIEENPQTRNNFQRIEDLKRDTASLRDQLRDIVKKSTIDSAKSARRSRAFKIEIQAQVNRANQLELQLAAKIDSLPQIDSLLTLKQSIINTQASEIDSLHQDLITERDSFKQFRVKVDEVNARTDELIAEYVKLNDALMADNFKLRKENRKPKFIRGMLVGVLTTVGIYVAVNQLVE